MFVDARRRSDAHCLGGGNALGGKSAS
jgi:hypothetical protein